MKLINFYLTSLQFSTQSYIGVLAIPPYSLSPSLYISISLPLKRSAVADNVCGPLSHVGTGGGAAECYSFSFRLLACIALGCVFFVAKRQACATVTIDSLGQRVGVAPSRKTTHRPLALTAHRRIHEQFFHLRQARLLLHGSGGVGKQVKDCLASAITLIYSGRAVCAAVQDQCDQ
jgi:hypothetical protein